MSPTCANITLEKIRARISFGSLVFETPDVQSWGVNRSRSQLAASCNCSIEVPATTVFPVDQEITIEAGTEGNLRQIFTGQVLQITINPSFEDASSYVVNMSGQDKFHELEGKTFSRRQRTRGPTTFAAITNVISRAPQKGISLELRKQSGGSQKIANRDTNIREHSKLVRTDKDNWDPFRTGKDPDTRDPSDGGDTAGDVLDIKPKSVALSPGVSVLFSVQGTTQESGDFWSIDDTDIATLTDNGDGTALVTMRALGEATISFTKQSSSVTFSGKATVVGIPIHDHSSLGAGGPAYGVFGSD
jgi:hypothetical protein